MTDKEKAREYSFNIQSELFNKLPKELQVLWKEETEQHFIDGMRYKEEQLMKDAIDGKILTNYDGNILSYNECSEALNKFEAGDKVKIIIIKED